MSQEKSPFLVMGGILLLILGIISFIFSFRIFAGNGYVSYGMIGLGVILMVAARMSKMHGTVGLVMAAVWFLLMGLFNIYGINFVYDEYILGVLPILAGILLIVGI